MTMNTISAPNDCKVETPPALARAMAGLLADSPSATWLEPCVGRGVFLDALRDAGVGAKQVTAVELDSHDGIKDKCGRYLPGTDFFEWATKTKLRFDRVIGNPPYLPLHRLPKSVRDAALRVPRPSSGTVPPKANAWYAFACAILQLLRPGGSICLVLPSAWDYADYAADLRAFVYQRFGRVAVYRSEVSVFPRVLDGCVVLAAHEFGNENRCRARRTFPGAAELIAGLAKPFCESVSVSDGLSIPSPPPGHSRLVRFSDIARVRIGGVTGDAGYFLMSDARRHELGLTRAALVPAFTRARHLTSAIIEEQDWQSLLEAGERVWLFRPAQKPSARPPVVAKYLASGSRLGVPEREKVRARDPWFRTRLPPRPDGIMSGMTPHGPWLSLVNMSRLTATNTLYTVHFRDRLSIAWKAAWALSLLTSQVAEQHASLGRRYSDGLLKFEPRDVMNLCVPRPSAVPPRTLTIYRHAVAALLSCDESKARRLADDFFFDRFA